MFIISFKMFCINVFVCYFLLYREYRQKRYPVCFYLEDSAGNVLLCTFFLEFLL